MSPNTLGTGHHRSAYPIPPWVRGYPAYLRDAGYYTTNNAKTDYNTSRAQAIIADAWDASSGKAGWWNRAPGQPFFSVFNFAESHQSRTMTNPRAWYEERVLAELPDSLRADSAALTVPPIFRDSPAMRGHLARVYNSINLMDRRVGQLLARLEAAGLRDSTIIFFYADHGEAVPGGKCVAGGLGYRVPFVVWFPPAYAHLSPWAAGSVSEELLVFQDLGPTLISLTGGDVPAYQQGRPALGPHRRAPPPYVFAGRNRLDETPDLARSVTDGRYVYTRNFLPQYPPLKFQKYADVADIVRTIRHDGAAGHLDATTGRLLAPRPAETLYDLEADPWELHDLSTDPAHAERRERMRGALRERILADRDVHFLPERELAGLEMPHAFRQDTVRFPLADVLATAERDPTTAGGRAELIAALRHPDATVRYWAAAALSRRPFGTAVAAALEDALADRDPNVVIQAAGGLVRHTESGRAAELLGELATSDDHHLAFAALQQIAYAGDRRRSFLPVLERVLERVDTVTDKNLQLNLRSSAETIRYLEGEGPLYYENMKAWVR